MGSPSKIVQHSISLPEALDSDVREMAEARELATEHMLVQLIMKGIESEKRRQRERAELTQRLRESNDPREVMDAGIKLGRMMFED